MNRYQEGLSELEERFGNYKDNVISFSTIACELSANGEPRPVVREMDAYYESGIFYTTSTSKSNKAKQIAENNEVAIAVSRQWFTANGTAENLGWISDPKNADIRSKLRKAFEYWYDRAIDESDEDTCILAVRLSKGTLNINHGERVYHFDFINKTLMDDGGIY